VERNPSYSLFLGFLLATGIASAPAWARFDSVPGSRYTAARAAALGDSYLPLGEDAAAALFYNPANVGKIRKTVVEPLNLSLDVNSGYINSIDRNFLKVTGLDGYAGTLMNYPANRPGVGASLLPSFATRGFAFGFLAQSSLMAQAVGTNINYRALYQFIPTVATGLRLASGVLRLGYSLQWVNKASGDLTVAQSASPMGWLEGLAQGSAFSHNFGLAFTLPFEYLPSLNVVARNVAGAHYTTSTLFSVAKNTSGPPADDPMSIDASFSIQPRIAQGAYFNWIVQMRDLTNASGTPFLVRMTAGLEIVIKDYFNIRGGFGSGYPSAGIGLKSKRGEFSISWYSEELGTSWHANQNEKFIFNYQLRVF
jgi:hypothetical protein